MKLREYLDYLQGIAEDPKALDYEMVYASDDKGNNFSLLNYAPTLGTFENNEFQAHTHTLNAICVN